MAKSKNYCDLLLLSLLFFNAMNCGGMAANSAKQLIQNDKELTELRSKIDEANREITEATTEYNDAFYMVKTTRQAIERRRFVWSRNGVIAGLISMLWATAELKSFRRVPIGWGIGLAGSELITQWYKLKRSQNIQDAFDFELPKDMEHRLAQERYDCGHDGCFCKLSIDCKAHRLGYAKENYNSLNDNYWRTYYSKSAAYYEKYDTMPEKKE